MQTIDRSSNRFCGPLALAAILGHKTTAESAALLRSVTGKRSIKGVWSSSMLDALHAAGCKTQSLPVSYPRPTVAGWLRTTKRDPELFYLLNVTGHYIVVRGRKIMDTFTNGEWTFLRRAPGRRKRVRNVWLVQNSPR